MDYNTVIFWFVCLSCLSGLVMVLKQVRSVGFGWVVVYLAILLVSVVGLLCQQPALIYTGAAMWLLLVLAPGLIARLYHQRFIQQRYSAAARLARVISWLHPADGWRDQPKIIHALDLAQRGELPAALEILRLYQDVKSLIGMAAVINFYRLSNQWEELMVWQARHLQAVEQCPQLLPSLLRAKGETGDLQGMVALYDRCRLQIGKLNPATSRDMCRLLLFAFGGKRPAVESLFDGSLSVLPASTRDFWLATADQSAGATDSAKQQFDRLLPAADPPLRLAIQRRLSRISVPTNPLDASAERLIEEAAREHGHDEKFGARPSLFSKQARATQILITLNVFMFAVEAFCGGGTDPETLYRLGALYPPSVRAGEWWRLVTSLFLHFGALHLAMNMLALWVLGPFMEFALGFRRFVTLYLIAGIGSMIVVTLFSSGPNGEQMTVGASGCIMGLVGATGALMLRAWRRDRALSAKRRLASMLLIVMMQSIFDSLVPQVSMTGHLSGALIGFVAALLLRDQLQATSLQPETIAPKQPEKL